MWVVIEERIPIPKATTPLYAKGVHMLDNLADDEVDNFLEDHPKIVPLFDIDIMETINPYVSEPISGERDIGREPDPKSVNELCHTREQFEWELAISQCIRVSINKHRH